MSETWKHDDLAADLRKYLEGNKADRMIWCDMQLGPAGSPRRSCSVRSTQQERA